MKARITLFSLAILAFLLMDTSTAQAQDFCYNFAGGFVNTAGVANGSIGHRQAGTFGLFSGTEAWTAIGQSPFPSPISLDQPYGMRVQRNGTGTLFQIQRRSSTGGPFDSNIFFGDVQTNAAEAQPSRLDFRYFQQNQTASPPTLRQSAAITMIGASSKPVSTTLSALCFSIFPGPSSRCYIRMGLERTNPSYTLDVNGLLRVQSTIITSDARFKKDINTIENSLAVLQNLRGTTYEFRSDEKFEGFDFGEGIESGFIAQEVETVLPHLVATDDQGYKAVNYTGVIPYLVEGTKSLDDQTQELQVTVDAQENRINELEAQNAELVRRLEALENNAITGKGATATLDSPAKLFQNVPNPFDRETEIRYFIPENSGQAQLLVFDLNGRQLRSYDLREAGEGSVTIEGNELEAGMYIYSLVANGEEIATKRMILTK